MKEKNVYIDYLILSLVVIIAYWQVSLLQFTIKHDAALLSLPWKKFVSDSLRSNYFPIWNPYINMGWVQGMELSTWYYPSWIFALFGKFRLSFLQVEITLHLILAAVGMYKFLTLFNINRLALVHGSLIYVLSGFFIANFQHLGWIYYACWLPWLLFYFLHLIKTPGFLVSIKLGLVGSMLVLGGYIPFSVTTAIFLGLFLVVFYLKKWYYKKIKDVFRSIGYFLISIIVLVIICAPAIYMIFINMDTIYRSSKYSDQVASFGSLVPMSLLNFLFPLGSTVQSTFWNGTDISMNNIFIGWITFLFIGLSFLEKGKKKMVLLISSLGIIALLLSFGKYFPPTWFFFRHLPFYEKLRFAAMFRIYFIFSATILVAIGTHYFFQKNKKKTAKWFLTIAAIIFLLVGIYNNHYYFLQYFNLLFVQEQNAYSLWQTIKFQSMLWALLCIILILLNYVRNNNSQNMVSKIVFFNILIVLLAVQMNMFYTGVANLRVINIDKEWLKLPEKFGSIPNKPFMDYHSPPIGATWTNRPGLYHFPSINCYHPYDSKNFGEYMKREATNDKSLSIIFASPNLNEFYSGVYDIYYIPITDSLLFTPYFLKFTTNNHNADSLFIQVSKTKYTKVYVNNQPFESEIINSKLMVKNVPANSQVRIRFLPPYGIFSVVVGLTAFILLFILVAILGIADFLRRT